MFFSGTLEFRIRKYIQPDSKHFVWVHISALKHRSTGKYAMSLGTEERETRELVSDVLIRIRAECRLNKF